uniref:Uncharacterized protein n=1 Tax=Leersia perrieri TaxID=77586 RepID=A0A0D9V5N8_9ORYZ
MLGPRRRGSKAEAPRSAKVAAGDGDSRCCCWGGDASLDDAKPRRRGDQLVVAGVIQGTGAFFVAGAVLKSTRKLLAGGDGGCFCQKLPALFEVPRKN